jgi:hypothetical protein
VERLRGNRHLGEAAESGVDAVGGCLAPRVVVHDVARRADSRTRAVGDRDGRLRVRDGHEVVERERGAVEENHAGAIIFRKPRRPRRSRSARRIWRHVWPRHRRMRRKRIHTEKRSTGEQHMPGSSVIALRDPAAASPWLRGSVWNP